MGLAVGREARLLSVCLLILAACAGGAGDEKQVRGAAGAFYDLYLKTRPSGVPDKDRQTQLQPLLSDQLGGLLSDAAAVEANYAKATKGESPPLVEGDLFTSLFEGAESYQIAQCEMQKKSAACAVDFTYTDSRDKSKLAWSDRVYLIRDKQKWLVDDIEFLGAWEFMHKGRLKDLLKNVIEEGKNPAG